MLLPGSRTVVIEFVGHREELRENVVTFQSTR